MGHSLANQTFSETWIFSEVRQRKEMVEYDLFNSQGFEQTLYVITPYISILDP